jgi:hypothetical protein
VPTRPRPRTPAHPPGCEYPGTRGRPSREKAACPLVARCSPVGAGRVTSPRPRDRGWRAGRRHRQRQGQHRQFIRRLILVVARVRVGHVPRPNTQQESVVSRKRLVMWDLWRLRLLGDSPTIAQHLPAAPCPPRLSVGHLLGDRPTVRIAVSYWNFGACGSSPSKCWVLGTCRLSAVRSEFRWRSRRWQHLAGMLGPTSPGQGCDLAGRSGAVACRRGPLFACFRHRARENAGN